MARATPLIDHDKVYALRAFGELACLDLLTGAMLERMQYRPEERDLVLLVHHFDASYPDGRKEHITSTLEAYGQPGGYSAMARTVSLPAAIAANLVLRGEIKMTGVHIPVMPEIYGPVLNELETMGVKFVEKTQS